MALKHNTNTSTCGLLGAALALLGACDSAPPEPFVPEPEVEGISCTIEGDERFLPMVTGTTWAYDIEKLKSGTVEAKTQVVGDLEDVGDIKAGIMAYKVTTTKTNGDVVAWQEDTGTSIRRHREQDLAGMTHHDEWFTDFKLRLDESPENLAEGASWTVTYTEEKTNLATLETAISERVTEWSVARFGEEVTTPAGTFCTMQVRRMTTVDGAPGKQKQYWFARGVGKVKERSGNRREVLVSYDIP